MSCFRCGGTGYVAVNCPYCRDSDPFEHENLSARRCLGCHDSGVLEEICPECGGQKRYQIILSESPMNNYLSHAL